MKKIDILAIGAHPDDIELGCGATLAKLAKAGKTTGVVDLTQGELGTRGTPEIRKQEATAAAKILNLEVRENIGLQDGFFDVNQENLLKLIEQIRLYKPSIILCNAPQDRHPDHGQAAKLVTKACFLSGLRKIYTGQEPWRPNNVFHYIQWENLKPDFIIDVTGFLDTKLQSCMAYQSQFYQPQSTEPTTPISSKNFLDSITYRAKDMGRHIGTDAAEGFVLPTSAYLGLTDFDSIV